jgi:MFS family permease
MSEQRNKQNEQNNEELEKKKSLKYFHGEVGAEAVGEASNAYAPASLMAAGAGSSTVAMMSTLNNFVAALLYIKVPAVIQKMGSRKKAILLLALLDAIGWLPLIAILLFFKPINPIWLIPCWIVNLIPGMLLAPARSSWLADLVPANIRGRYFGLRAAISGAVYIGTFYVFSCVLQIFNDQALNGFALLFFVAFVAGLICFLIYSRIHNTPVTPEKDTDFGFFDFLGETRRRNLGKFILFVALFQFAVYLASPFFAPYILGNLHFSYIFFALVFSSEFLAKVLIVTFWGKYADKGGNLKIMRIVSFAIPFVPLLWLASHNIIYLVMVQLFSGACWAGFDLCSGNFIYEAAPPGKRLKYIAYHKALSTLFMALGALAGVYLLSVVRPVLGYNILALFVLSGVLRLAVTMVMFPKLREVRGTMRSCLNEPAMVTAVAPTVMHRQALLRRPNEWIRFGRPMAPEAVTVAEQTEPTIGSRGLFYRQREWPVFSKSQGFEASPSESQSEPVATSRGLFHQPRGWAQFDRPLATEATTAEPQTRSEKVAANWGLFYRPGEWSMFGRPQAPQASYPHAQSETDTVAAKRGLFHRAQGWFGSDKPATAEKNIRQLGRLQPATVLA